jgi:Flp pilus assembly pilin Flp
LILTFILIKQFEAIGFLLAAKSVFRFGDLKDESDRKRTEYILVGTLISFTITIGLGLVIGFLL